MRLPHHPEALAGIRAPSDSNPWRVLVSGCLCGFPVAVDGTDYGLSTARPPWLTSTRVVPIPFCPENHRLGTPRTMPDLHGGDGFAVLDGHARVLDEHRKDLTEGMVAGAKEMVRIAGANQIDFALLLDRSGACGSQVVSIGCRFEEPVVHKKGVGVAAAALLRAGFHVVSQRDYRTLDALHAKIDSTFVPSVKSRDHHESPWVIENLG